MSPSEDTPSQDIEKLRKRYETLRDKKITAEANLQTSAEMLENLKKQARDKYGTDDLATLRSKLDEMTEENERKRIDYQQHLTEIETALAAVEAKHADAANKAAQS
jgi:hypothetical protein